MTRFDYRTRRWALAFAGGLPGKGELDEALELLGVLVPIIKKIPGRLAGTGAAKRLDALIREGAAGTGVDERPASFCGRFLALLIGKGLFSRIDAVMGEIQNIAASARGVLPVYAESAFPMEEEEKRDFIEGIKKGTGAAEIRLEVRVNPELLGGYRLRIGSGAIDASIRGQLQKMAAALAAGEP
jgi:F-type H+-transporting ATPase subunit delta